MLLDGLNMGLFTEVAMFDWTASQLPLNGSGVVSGRLVLRVARGSNQRPR